ncbi:MAG: exo-alpha-sialidase [Clostridia bacterium]|nr:exo-alpha-sialidase [Clostridia bacterium]
MFFKKKPFSTKCEYYKIPLVDLSVKPENTPENLGYLFKYTIVDDNSAYLGHPDSVLLNNGDILTFYPKGHGKGAIISKISDNDGLSYDKEIENQPVSWEKSLETPTVYRLQFRNGEEKLILISANSKWPGMSTPGGFNSSISSDEGKTWTEFKRFWDNDSETPLIPIVAMASLTRLKEYGEFVDKWMGLFHDHNFVNYKTILTFSENGEYNWSKPEPYLSAYRDIETYAGVCEVECIRSDKGIGDELCLIARCNKKRNTSLLFFSQDEGKTWSKPIEAPVSLNGERHKAEYTNDGRLFITFRSIERNRQMVKKMRKDGGKKTWYSEGWIAWVGTYDDLKNGTEGQYRIKIAHTYLDHQNKPSLSADADTGYCGNVVLKDGTIVTSSYGVFSTEEKESGTYTTDKGKQKRKTFIVSKRIKLSDVEKLIKQKNC